MFVVIHNDSVIVIVMAFIALNTTHFSCRVRPVCNSSFLRFILREPCFIARLSNIGADISQFGNELLQPLPLQLRQKIFGANPGRFADLVAWSGKIKLAALVSASGMAFSQNCKASLPGRRDEHLFQ